MADEVKPVKSPVFWAALLGFIPAIDAFLNTLGLLPTGLLPEAAAVITSTIASIGALIGRYTGYKKA